MHICSTEIKHTQLCFIGDLLPDDVYVFDEVKCAITHELVREVARLRTYSGVLVTNVLVSRLTNDIHLSCDDFHTPSR